MFSEKQFADDNKKVIILSFGIMEIKALELMKVKRKTIKENQIISNTSDK